MPVFLNQILMQLDRLYPPGWAQNWDKVGLQVGDAKAGISKILVCLDILPQVIEEANQQGAQLIICHHPLIFKPIDRLDICSPLGGLINSLIKTELNVYVAHTNLDAAPSGVNDLLAQKIGLTDVSILQPQTEKLNKVVVFVPREHAQLVYENMAAAGAGRLGSYSHCAFYSEGTGTFKPKEDSKPFIGEKNHINRVPEVRIESLVSETKLGAVMAAIYSVHPYEEVACDIYSVSNWGKGRGLGRLGSLPRQLTLGEFCVQLKQKLMLQGLRLTGNAQRTVSRVAVYSGSGGDAILFASRAGADVLVTGDIKYHQAHEAQALGLAIADIGHYHSERMIVKEMATNIRRLLKQAGYGVKVVVSQVEKDIFNFV
jgi:dinuclear metal center YbgI/SA1388 family protein